MRTISSPRIFFYKRVFPLMWFGSLALFAGLGFVNRAHAPPPAIALIVPIVMAMVGIVVVKRFIFDLVEEVVDAGDHLLVTKGGTTVTIRFADIMNVNYSLYQNPPRITLRLATPSQLGADIAFLVPRERWRPFAASSALADELIQRVDAARRALPPSAP
jgi:hypothetical protein